MTKQTKIYLVRHGESELNKQAILAGHIDTVLTELGKQQAQQTKDVLKGVNFDVAYSSDLARAIQTAEIIYGKPITKRNQLVGLRERTYGELEGLPGKVLRPTDETKYSLSHLEQWSFKNAPNMESDQELSDRFMKTLAKIAKANIGKTILVVAHGGPIRTTLMVLNNLTNKDYPRGSFQNAGYVELAFDGNHFKVEKIRQ